MDSTNRHHDVLMTGTGFPGNPTGQEEIFGENIQTRFDQADRHSDQTSQQPDNQTSAVFDQENRIPLCILNTIPYNAAVEDFGSYTKSSYYCTASTPAPIPAVIIIPPSTPAPTPTPIPALASAPAPAGVRTARGIPQASAPLDLDLSSLHRIQRAVI